MKKEQRKRKDENLAQWVSRLVPCMMGRGLVEVLDMVSEISKVSYLAGIKAAEEIEKKRKNYEEK